MPRLSFAYRLSGRTVIRAGAGLYDETMLGQMFYSLTGVHTSDYRSFTNSINNGAGEDPRQCRSYNAGFCSVLQVDNHRVGQGQT